MSVYFRSGKVTLGYIRLAHVISGCQDMPGLFRLGQVLSWNVRLGKFKTGYIRLGHVGTCHGKLCLVSTC